MSAKGTRFHRSDEKGFSRSQSPPSRRAIFFDRDGVLNYRKVDGYITSPGELHLIPDAGPALLKARELGYVVIVVTNQRGIARGLMSLEDLALVHAHLKDELSRIWGVELDGIYFCPHDRGEGCSCRKPSPGMLLEAAKEHNLDLSLSWMIGDAPSDITAGSKAGCRTAFVGEENRSADLSASGLTEILSRIGADLP